MPKTSRPLSPAYVARAEPPRAASPTSTHVAATTVMPRAFFMSFLLLLSMPWLARPRTAFDSPCALHVRFVGRDREAAVVEPRCHPCGGRRLEVAELVLHRRQQPTDSPREADGRIAAGVGPDLAAEGNPLGCGGFEPASHARDCGL